MIKKKKILIIGGAGYVGSRLSSYLAGFNYEVFVLDLFIYGENVFSSKKIKILKGDIRDRGVLKKAINDKDIVIHLACISNDPSFDLDPVIGKSINYDSFLPILDECKNSNIERFIYASSSSVYGIKSEKNVHEEILLDPITDYSKYKAMCENLLLKYKANFCKVVVRPATVCGYSKRQRLDLVVNILTNLGYHKNEILVMGGSQLRPNIHIDDMILVYKSLLDADEKLINKEVFNAGYENLSIRDIADEVKKIIGSSVNIKLVKTDDERSYHISSEKIKNILNFKNSFQISDAIKDLVKAFDNKEFKDPLNNEIYYNVKKMKNFNFNNAL